MSESDKGAEEEIIGCEIGENGTDSDTSVGDTGNVCASNGGRGEIDEIARGGGNAAIFIR
jgi:hypothetical protein